jgi:predicted nucleic acid-binding Zn ribbon protein
MHAACVFRGKIIYQSLCGTNEYDYLPGFADDDEVTCPECQEILWGDHNAGWVPPAGYA